MKKLNFGKQKRLNLPQINSVLNRWAVLLTLIKVSQNIVDGDNVEVLNEYEFYGVWQPMSGERLEAKSEGQRSWEWVLLHIPISELNQLPFGKYFLSTGDKILYQQTRFKVVSVKDYSLYGYAEYELCRDYEDEQIYY